MNSIYWQLANAVDILHLPVALAIWCFPRLWLPQRWALIVPALATISQIVVMGCPLVLLSTWLRGLARPEQAETYARAFNGSLTAMMYQRYGPLAGVPLLAISIALSVGFWKVRMR